MSDKYTSGEYQRAVGELVSREVYHNLCQTMMLMQAATHDWSPNDPSVRDELNDMEEFFQYDYESAVDNSDYKWNEDQEAYMADGEESIHCDQDDYQEVCNQANLDADPIEFYEFWAVSEYFGDKLKDKGQTVVKILDFNVWGRCTTGQAIALDRVVCDIYDDMKA